MENDSTFSLRTPTTGSIEMEISVKYLENNPNAVSASSFKPGKIEILANDSLETTRIKQQLANEIDFEKLTELCQNLESAVQEILDSCGIYFRIFSRVKTLNSLARKLWQGKYGTDANPKKIQDLIGLRVVLYYCDDLSICRDIIESTFQMIDGWARSKYNANEFRAAKINGVFHLPKEYFNSYKKELWTLPIDTTFEIQFRTVFFEGWHEIEHDMRYKSFFSDDEFWDGSEELSRVLNCILANLELSDWSLVQLFDQLSYNHYKNENWQLMLKSKFRIKIDDKASLDSGILDIFNRDKEIAKQFFKASRKTLIRELLKNEHNKIDYNLIIRLLNHAVVHNEELEKICDSLPYVSDRESFQKMPLARLESNILFYLELPLLHKNTRKFDSEFHNAAVIIYKWARFRLNPVFEDIPSEVSSYKNNLPGYQIKIKFDPQNYAFSMKMHYIDSKAVGTLWHVQTSIERMDDGNLHFFHVTSRDVPRGISHGSNFSKPSFLADLSNKVGLVDVVRLGSKAVFTTTDEELFQLRKLIEDKERKLPLVVITQYTKDTVSDSKNAWDYDMNTFTINGTRLAKVIGHYAHVYMVDYSLVADFSEILSVSKEDALGCICIFWPHTNKTKRTFFSRQMVLDTQFDFNRFAFHDDNIYEKAFRHNLVQLIKDDNVTH